MNQPPAHLDLKKDRGLTIQWADGATSYYSIAYLRAMSPSAEARDAREKSKSNPLHILSSKAAADTGPLTALGAELVGNYALRINFSDGHSTGLYTWDYLRQIDQRAKEDRASGPGEAPPTA